MPGEFPIGTVMSDRYRIISVLGQGGMGLTYRAWDLLSSRPVVLKHPRREMLEKPGFIERFDREARMMAALSHPHVVPITTIGEHEGVPYLVMPFLPGGSLLHHRVRDSEGRPRPMLPSTLHLWLPQVADALDYVHSCGIVHRDVKPANLFFNGFWHAYLGDFGIAKTVGETSAIEKEQTLTSTNMMVGTHEYMAPEMFAPKATVTGKADQYALAVMVYEILAGRRPFTGEKTNLIVEVATQRVPSLRDMRLQVPESLESAVYRGLAKRPDERFGDCKEFVGAALVDVPGMEDEPGLARLACPGCGNVLKLKGTVAGRLGRCPRCQSEMIVAADLSALWLLGEEAGKSTVATTSPVTQSTNESSQSEAPDPVWELPPPTPAEPPGRRRSSGKPWLEKPPLVALSAGALATLFLVAAIAYDWGTSSLRGELRKVQDSLRSALKQIEDSRASARESEAAMKTLQVDNARLVKENAELRSTPGAGKFQVPKDAVTFNGRSYWFSTQKKTHPEALVAATAAGGGLVVIDDQSENDFIAKSIKGPAWTGVCRSGEKWIKLADGSPVSFAKWRPGQPSLGGGESGAAIAPTGLWDDHLSTDPLTYCIEFPTPQSIGFESDAAPPADAGQLALSGSMILNRQQLGGSGGGRYSDIRKGSKLVGLATTEGNYGGHRVIASVRAIYRDGDKTVESDTFGGNGGSGKVLLAKPGYAVGAMVGKAGHLIDGFRLIFMRDRGDALDPSDSYESEWVGGQGGGEGMLITGGGVPVNGISGAAGGFLDSLSLSFAENSVTPSIATASVITNSIGAQLILVPANEFVMGQQGGDADEKPHQVALTSGFYCGAYEVSNAQWKRVMGSVPSEWKDDNLPVEQVSWDEAVDFCRKLSALPEERKFGRVYRLPTEAEWECACRAGTTTNWSWGRDESPFGEYAWLSDNSGGKTHPVGKKKPNALGLYDMHGNVWEWCSDWYGDYGNGTVTDPRGPSGSSDRVGRGGSWRGNVRNCRSADRFGRDPSSRVSHVGFRLALTPPLSAQTAANSIPMVVDDDSSKSDEPATSSSGPVPSPIPSLLLNSIEMQFRAISPGTFTMGEVGGAADEPPHLVSLTTPFCLGVYEVTNAQWARVMGNVPGRWKDDDRPVHNVSWDDATAFCRKLSQLPDERAAGRVYRLPTECEWEYACRAGTQTRYSFGDAEEALGENCWFTGNSDQYAHPVGQKKPNPWGLYDMHGNVWEWCSDWNGAYPNGAVKDPSGASNGDRRIVRGGSWKESAANCRSANRSRSDPAKPLLQFGFRVALIPGPSDRQQLGVKDSAAEGGSAAGESPPAKLVVLIPNKSDKPSKKLDRRLESIGFTIRAPKQDVTAKSLAKVPLVYVQSGPSPFSPDEVAAIEKYVASGGALLCVGLAWPWVYPAYGNKPLETFPLNVLGDKLGFKVSGEAVGPPVPVEEGLFKGLSKPQLISSEWAPSAISLKAPGGEVASKDSQGRPIVVAYVYGMGRVMVFGHFAMLDEDEEILRRTIRYLLPDAAIK